MGIESGQIKRLELHKKLVDVLGANHVYFDPPKTVKMSYPAIRYSLSNDPANFANNRRYVGHEQYRVDLIVLDPDTVLRDKMYQIPMCSLSTTYVADGLHHFIFTIYC